MWAMLWRIKKSGFKPSTLRQRVRRPPTTIGRILSPVPKLISGKTDVLFFFYKRIRIPTRFAWCLERFHRSLQSWWLFMFSDTITAWFQTKQNKKTKHLDQLCAGIPTRTNGSIVQVPHFLFFLTCLQDKTGKQVEDFYNSRCGGPASERCRVPVRYRGLFEYAHIQTATERECFSLTLSEEKGAVQRWFKEQSEQNRTQRCRMSKKHKEGGNSFSHRSTSSSLKKKKKFFMSSSFKTQQVFVVMDLKYLLSSTESQEPDEGVCQEKLFAQRK